MHDAGKRMVVWQDRQEQGRLKHHASHRMFIIDEFEGTYD